MKRAFLAGVALICALATASEAASAADVEEAMRGRRLFLRCSSCHAIKPDAPARIGPNLHGVIGRKAGSAPGFGYSPALKAAGFVWNDAMLDRWLADPEAVVPGNAMAFLGLSDAKDRKAVIAYLAKN